MREHISLWWPGKTLPAWLCSPDSSIVLRDCALSHGHLVRVSEFFFMERNFHSLEDCIRQLEEFSAPKENHVVGRRNGEITRMRQGSEKNRWRHCAVMLWGDNEKRARHCISGQKAKDPFCQAISRLCVPSLGICCPLVVIFRNDILVQGCRKSGQTQWRISDFSWQWYLHVHLKTSQCQLCPITLWPVSRFPSRDQ